MKELVIIGAGMAGITAAQEARMLHSQEELSITIITMENPPSYIRPQLTELPSIIAAAVHSFIKVYKPTDLWHGVKMLKSPAKKMYSAIRT